MTKLSTVFMVASATLSAALLGATPASAGFQDRDRENRGGLLAGAQNPTVTQKGSFVHRGKAIVWVPNESPQATGTKANRVVGRESGSASPRIRATTAGGSFVQNGKVTTWVPAEDLAAHLRHMGPSGRSFNPNSTVVLLGGAEVHRDLLADVSGDYILETGALTQPPAVTRSGAFIHSGKTIRWMPKTNSGPMLGQ